jgi:hypothetical protein
MRARLLYVLIEQTWAQAELLAMRNATAKRMRISPPTTGRIHGGREIW